MMAVDGRRLWRAGLLTLAVFLFVGGGFGFAAAAVEADDERTLTVPAPRPGDRATYALEEVVVDPALAEPGAAVPREVSYEWLPERWEPDADFQRVLVHPLRSSFTFPDHTHVIETTYEAATGAVVSEAGSWGFQGTGYHGGSMGTIRTIEGRYDVYQGQIGLCGFRVPFQGRAYDGSDFRVQGRCDWPSGSDGFTFTDNGWTSNELGRVRAFAAVEDARFFLEFDEASPFPARAAAVFSEVLTYPGGRYFLLERVSVGRGESPYTPVAQPVAQHPADPVPVAPRTDWGLDEAGIQGHRFLLSEAYRAALDLPTTPQVEPGAKTGPDAADWLADHPTAYLASALPFEGRDRSGQPAISWFLAWTDGTAVLGKHVAYGPMGVEFLFLPNATGEHARVYDWDTEYAWGQDGTAPSSWPWTPGWQASWPWGEHGPVKPEDVPADLPRPAEIMERFTAMGGVDPNFYAFSIECADAACSQPLVSVLAGHSSETIESSYTGQYDQLIRPLHQVEDQVGVDGQGRLESRWRYGLTETASVPVFPPPAEPHGADDGRSGHVAAIWVFPSAPAAAAGLSFVAVLAGALYYFWPALKGAIGVGLFSRVDNRAILDLPTRRRLYDAILAEPGIHFMALARKADVGRSALDHHLRRLVAADLVVVRKAPGYTCYFAKGAVDRKVAETAPALRSEGSRAVFDAVRAEPGLSCRELARRLGRSPSTVNYHLQRLREAGLVFGAGAGVHPSPLGEQAAAMAA